MEVILSVALLKYISDENCNYFTLLLSGNSYNALFLSDCNGTRTHNHLVHKPFSQTGHSGLRKSTMHN